MEIAEQDYAICLREIATYLTMLQQLSAEATQLNVMQKKNAAEALQIAFLMWTKQMGQAAMAEHARKENAKS